MPPHLKSSSYPTAIPVSSKLWCQVGMDIVGPLPETLKGNKYIVTLPSGLRQQLFQINQLKE